MAPAGEGSGEAPAPVAFATRGPDPGDSDSDSDSLLRLLRLLRSTTLAASGVSAPRRQRLCLCAEDDSGSLSDGEGAPSTASSSPVACTETSSQPSFSKASAPTGTSSGRSPRRKPPGLGERLARG